MNKKVSLVRLFLIFAKIGAVTLGGGYVILPIIINEFCEKHKLIKEEKVLDYFALSQSLPGIIAANISMFIGYHLRGALGTLVAMFGVIFIPMISIIVLATFLHTLVNNSYVQKAFLGIGVAIIALITLTAREILQKSKRDWYFYLIIILALICLIGLKFSPIQTILACVIIGLVIKTATKFSKDNT